MLGSTVLEVVIALVFLYLALSLVCSALNEYYSALMSRRATHLRDSLSILFNKDHPRGLRFLIDFFENPLISGLARSNPGRVAAPTSPPTAIADRTAGLNLFRRAVFHLARFVRKTINSLTNGWGWIAGGFQWVADVFHDPDGMEQESAELRKQLAIASRSTPSYIPDRAFSGAIFAILASDLDAIRRIDQEWTIQLGAIQEVLGPLLGTAPDKNLAKTLSEVKQTLKEVAQKARSSEEVITAAKSGIQKLLEALPADDPASPAARERLNQAMAALIAAGPRIPSPNQVRDHVWASFEAAMGRLAGSFGQLPAGSPRDTLLAKVDEIVRGIAPAKAEAPMSLQQARDAATRGFEAIRQTITSLGTQVDASQADEWLEREMTALATSQDDLITIAKLRDAVASLPTSEIRSALLSMMDEAGDDLNKVRQNIQVWYNDSMERVSGWYKRNTQVILAGVALAVCVLMNADTIAVAERLWRDSTLRANVNALARSADPQTLSSNTPADWTNATDHLLKETNLPLGWTQTEFNGLGFNSKITIAPEELKKTWFRKVLGLILSAIAVSIGAPFWFDILNKLVNIRTSGLQPRKSSDAPAGSPPAR